MRHGIVLVCVFLTNTCFARSAWIEKSPEPMMPELELMITARDLVKAETELWNFNRECALREERYNRETNDLHLRFLTQTILERDDKAMTEEFSKRVFARVECLLNEYNHEQELEQKIKLLREKYMTIAERIRQRALSR